MDDGPQEDALIRSLVADLRPVRPLPPPWRRTMAWLGAVALLGAALASQANLPAVAARVAATTEGWLGVAAAALTAVLAATAAFVTAVPGRRASWALLPVPAALLWLGCSGVGCMRDLQAVGWAPAAPGPEALAGGRHCLTMIVLLSLPSSAVLLLMLRRAFPLRPGLTAALGGLAAAAASAALLQLDHDVDATLADLAAHAVAIALVVAANRLLAAGVLRTGPYGPVPASSARP